MRGARIVTSPIPAARHDRDVDRAHALAGAAQRRVRRGIAARRQYPLACRNGSDGFGAIGALRDRIERQHGVGVVRQRFTGVDAARRWRQRHRRVGSGVGDRGGGHGKTVAHRDGPRRMLRRHDILGQREIARCFDRRLLRLHGADPRLDQRKDRRKRRQPGDALM